MPFKLIKSESIFTGRAFGVRRDWMETPDGGETNFDIIEHHGSVIIVPVDGHNIYFVEQYRHATGKELLELPAGTLETGEDPAACAAREIREETGFAASKLVKLGEFFLAPGYSTELMTVFLASGLEANPLESDSDEFISLSVIAIDTVFKMAGSGKIMDAKTLAALLLAYDYLKKQNQ